MKAKVMAGGLSHGQRRDNGARLLSWLISPSSAPSRSAAPGASAARGPSFLPVLPRQERRRSFGRGKHGVLRTRADRASGNLAQQVDALIEDITKTIKELGGHACKTEYWGLRNLTYRIKKNRKGHYALINIDAPPAVVHELERRCASTKT